MIFTFWEGDMPEYIKLCMKTWKLDYIVLNYNNLNQYTDLTISDNLKRFTLPQIADIVRVHTLRDNGGYWLDADTIMITNELPKENMIGFPEIRANTIGYLHTDKNSEMYKEWAKYQDNIINAKDIDYSWDIVGNRFTDRYVATHPEITIANVERCWAETYMITDEIPRRAKYEKFYFKSNYKLNDLLETNRLMLHNSWTTKFYKDSKNPLEIECTMSNILKELV